MQAIRHFDFDHAGKRFRASIYPDDTAGAPWERADGHGPVRFISDHEPLARGEQVLHDADRGRWVYDFGAALVQAWKEGWGLRDEDKAKLAEKLGKKPTKSQIRAETVRDDMRYLRGWCADDWYYVGVSVNEIDDDGELMGEPFSHSLWGIESDCKDYIKKVAHELADEMVGA